MFVRRSAFTLVELLVVMVIIAMLTAMTLAGLFSAQESAKAQRTRGTIAKIHNQVMVHWESFRTRRLPVFFNPAIDGNDAVATRRFAARKLQALWDIMRLEMPDQYADFKFPNDIDARNGATTPEVAVNALRQAYRDHLAMVAASRNLPGVTELIAEAEAQNASAECLYLIITVGMNADEEVRFLAGEVGDTDHDGLYEFLDGWGRPISFLRWAPGYLPTNPEYKAEFCDTDMQFARIESDGAAGLSASDSLDPDPFDPVGVGRPGAQPPSIQPPSPVPNTYGFKLMPLIFSKGPDGEDGIFSGVYNLSRAPNPYSLYPETTTAYYNRDIWRGSPLPGIEGGGHADNITNHRLGRR
jgi:prepilin-type N-terminal cleavage/methylation domain-containing protein